MTTDGRVRRVSVVSTGQVQIRPDHVESTWRPMFLWLLSSRHWMDAFTAVACQRAQKGSTEMTNLLTERRLHAASSR